MSAPAKPENPGQPFHWFGPETVDALREQLNAAGSCRLEVHQRGGALWLHVVPEGVTTEAAAAKVVPLNKSHLCPPDCP